MLSGTFFFWGGGGGCLLQKILGSTFMKKAFCLPFENNIQIDTSPFDVKWSVAYCIAVF